MTKLLTAIFFFLALQLFGQSDLNVRFQPGEFIYLHQANAGNPKEIYDAIIQNVAIVNNSEQTLFVDNLKLVVYKDSLEIQSFTINKERINYYADRINSFNEHGLLKVLDFQFQTSLYLKDVSFPKSMRIRKNDGIIVPRIPLLFDEIPDSIVAIASAYTDKEELVTAKNKLAVIKYVSKNKYNFPLKGSWTAFGAPSLNGHHRWTNIQEFAYDFVKIDSKGNSHFKDGSKLKHYYAYGEPVFSVGDGKVVSMYTEGTESNLNLRQANETEEEFQNKARANQTELLKKGFEFILGNHVVIEHANGEFSYYMHLKPGSTLVKVGDNVKIGQEIAALGHSGNSSEPHLHFQLSDNANLLNARGIPIVFQNVGDNEWTILYGEIIQTEK